VNTRPIRSYAEALDRMHALRDLRSSASTDRARRTRARLVEAASASFAEVGYRRASTADIARDAAVSKATVYAHFPTKAELLLAVLVEERIALYERMQPLLAADVPPAERLKRLLEQAVLQWRSLPISNRVKLGEPDMIAALSELDPEDIAAVFFLFRDIFAWLVREAAGELPEPDVRARAHVLILVLQALPTIAAPSRRGRMPEEELAEAFASLLVDGVRGPSAETTDAG